MFLLTDLIKDLIYFPIWWYGEGLKNTWIFVAKKIKAGYRNLALRILFINLFRPMYGEYNWKGRIISFFARLIILFWRLLEMLVWSFFVLSILILWLMAPIIVIGQIIFLLCPVVQF